MAAALGGRGIRSWFDRRDLEEQDERCADRRLSTRSIVDENGQLRELIRREHGLAVLATTRADGSVRASVVNAGAVRHPLTEEVVVGFVIRGNRHKLVNLRARPRATIVFRSGWDWVVAEGHVEIAGPDDAMPGLDQARVPHLLREIYAAAVGGSPTDWAGIEPQMTEERHTAVLLHPTRLYSNAPDAR